MQHFLTAIAAFSALANAHYTFSSIKVNGVAKGSDWTYFREHTRGYMPTYGNEIASNDFRCQPGAESGANTDVLEVKGGDKITMQLGFGKSGIDHPGPAAVFMSRAPSDDAKSYDGSGDWFKAFDSTLCTGTSALTTTSWCSWGKNYVEFEIPKRLPDGEYLIRPQHIGLHESQGNGKGAQYFYSCAQVKISGNSNGAFKPTRTVKFPGAIQEQDDGVKFNVWTQAQSYPYTPGGQLIIGGQTEGDATGSSGETVVNNRKRAVGGSLAARAQDLISS